MDRFIDGFKKILWPNHKNNFQPALIRTRGLFLILVLTIAIGSFSPLTKSNGALNVLGYATDVTFGGLLKETNEERENASIGKLALNADLSVAAQNKAEHMIANNYWSHEAPDGTTPWDFIDETDYVYLKAGENLAYGFATSAGVVDGWMDSPGHKANILDTDFMEVGFGIADGANFQNDENTLVVAMYAKPFLSTILEFVEEEAEPTTTTISQDSDTLVNETPLQKSTNPELYPVSQTTEEVLEEGISAKVISIYGALVSGDAPLSMYLMVGLLMLVGMVYVLRHIRIVHRFIVVGEHTLSGHPLLEASIVYALIWLVLTATYGVVV